MTSMKFLPYKKFVFQDPNSDIWDNKHVFFMNSENDIADVEEKLGMSLPQELKDFYIEIGYGFLCNGESYNTNRFISPIEIFDFYSGMNTYENDIRRQYYQDRGKLIFFEISAQAFLTIDIQQPNSLGQCPIYFGERKIANSLEEFLMEMDKKVDYYLA